MHFYIKQNDGHFGSFNNKLLYLFSNKNLLLNKTFRDNT